jgi:hypothetical protein
MKSIRSFLAVVSAALLTGLVVTAGIAAPAAAAKAGLSIVSVTDTGSGLGGPVKDKPFNVVVEVVGGTVTKDTTIKLQASGPGTLSGVTTAVIPANGSRATISGAKYDAYANGVVLTVSASQGGSLNPATRTVEVALTAVGTTGTLGTALDVKDPSCSAPTAAVPTCGELVLPSGADGHVILSVGSCDGLDKVLPCRTAGSEEALVVTAIATLKNDVVSPYDNNHPATLIVGCDKTLCRATANGVPKLPLIYTTENTGALTAVAQPCPAKGVLGAGQPVCVDYVQSSRNDGDLYTYLLFDIDLRASHP